MVEYLYGTLQHIGFGHPLHPPLAHMPTGLLIGAFIFFVIGRTGDRKGFFASAYHCMALALIFAVPTALFGITDWLHFYKGAWSFAIHAKIVLSLLLIIFLAIGVSLNWKRKGGVMSKLAVCFLCVVTVIGLGYFGGQLVFSAPSPSSGNLQQGEKLYSENCAGCHPQGGNTINADRPVVGSPYMKNPDAFTKFNRNPSRPDGTKGVMPPFPKEKISDADMTKIYDYIQNVLSRKK